MGSPQAAATAPIKDKRKGKDPRKHHYVPVFYQLGFANDKELLWVYDRRMLTLKELHPRVICFERDLYTLKPDNKPIDTQVESKVLSMVDGIGCAGIRSFQLGERSAEVEKAIALFVAFQQTRLPTISRDVRLTYAQTIEHISRMTFANVESATAALEKYARDTGERIEVTAESMVESVQGNHLKIVATEVSFLDTMMEQALRLSRRLRVLDWEMLVADEDTGFIICDNPVVVVPPKGCDQVGFLVPGSAKYFPISRHLCLRLGEPGKTRRFRKLDKESVRIVNQNIAANSERFIMGPSKLQIETVVARSGCAKMETIPRFILETMQADDDNALMKLCTQPRRYFYPKNNSRYAP